MISLALMCLSMNVYWEARNQSIAGQVAVAQITMNRVANSKYPNDICGVVHELNQFSWYWDGNSDVPTEIRAWKTAQLVAMGVLAGSGHKELMNIDITNYHAVYVSPYWKYKMEMVVEIEDHVFYID